MAAWHLGPDEKKRMNATGKNIAATVIAGGILGLFAVLWQFNDRLARIETNQSNLTQAVENVLQNQDVFRGKIAVK